VSKENVEVVQRVCSFWEQGDFAGSPDAFDADVEFVHTGIPDAGIYHGREAMARAWREWLHTWENFRAEVQQLIDAGEDTVALLRICGRGKGSGVEIDLPAATLFTLRDGKIVRLVLYGDQKEALEAAGLSEQNARGDTP
jgi:ketosteroid isomerase-like protein